MPKEQSKINKKKEREIILDKWVLWTTMDGKLWINIFFDTKEEAIEYNEETNKSVRYSIITPCYGIATL